VIKTRKRATIL